MLFFNLQEKGDNLYKFYLNKYIDGFSIETDEDLFIEALKEVSLPFMKMNLVNFFKNIFQLNLFIFGFFLENRFTKYINFYMFIGFQFKNRFTFIKFTYVPFKFFKKTKPHFSVNSSFLTPINSNSKYDILRNFIILKKKNGLLKKKNKLKNFILLKINVLKNYKISTLWKYSKNKNLKLNNFFLNKNITSLSKIDRFGENNKHLDIRRRWFSFFKTNREILKYFTKINYSKKNKITKYFSKIIKYPMFYNLIKSEFSVINLLIRSKFVFNEMEANFFLQNGFVFLNGCSINNNVVIKLGDVLSLSISDDYFNFYKINLSNKLKLTYSIGYVLWRLNRFKGNFYKQPYTKIPDWIYKLNHFYEDVPSFLEVDYSVLSCVIVKYPQNFYNYNYNFTKFISFFLNRQYNWKCVN